MKKHTLLLVASIITATSVIVLAATPLAASGEQLQRPRDLRELVFLSSGYGMAYGPARDLSGSSAPFTNVYVSRDAYASYMASGRWPDGSTFFLEVRRGDEHVSINSGGRSQGEMLALEAAVKDTRRYPEGGWAYFDFPRTGTGFADTAEALPRSMGCYACHSKHGAVEWTFTQFYPEQFEVAKLKGTVRRDYDPNLQAN